jgi:hypothetical protein
MHAEEAHIGSLLFLEGKHGPGPVGEVVQHLTRVHVPNNTNINSLSTKTIYQLFKRRCHEFFDLWLFFIKQSYLGP